MNLDRASLRPDRAEWLKIAGGLTSVALAIALYTRFSINGELGRDRGIYVYGGQQMLHGVAPYESVFDPKTPLATMLCGLGAALAKLFGVDAVHMIRLVFFACAVLAVLAIYLLVARLWNSIVGAVVAAAVFVSFTGFAEDAIAGPDAKTPGVLLAVVTMWLAVCRRWFWAGLAGGLTFLVWQPLLFFPLLTIAAALLLCRGERSKALMLSAGGFAAPIAATFVYFAVVGQLGAFIEAAFRYPLEGVERRPETVFHRMQNIATVVHQFFGFSGVLFWIGLVLILALAVWQVVRARDGRWAALLDPFVLVVVGSLLGVAGYTLTDFQGYPDVLPLLPYAAIGIGGTTALVLRRLQETRQWWLAGVAIALVAAAVLTGFSVRWFDHDAANNDALVVQRATACAVNRLVVPGTRIYSLGDPVPLVLTHRRNPDRFIYLNAGVDQWKVDHTPGGFQGWTGEIEAVHPSVVVINGWWSRTPYRSMMSAWLSAAGYHRGYVGDWEVFLSPQARARSVGVGLSKTQSDQPMTATGKTFTNRMCEHT